MKFSTTQNIYIVYYTGQPKSLGGPPGSKDFLCHDWQRKILLIGYTKYYMIEFAVWRGNSWAWKNIHMFLCISFKKGESFNTYFFICNTSLKKIIWSKTFTGKEWHKYKIHSKLLISIMICNAAKFKLFPVLLAIDSNRLYRVWQSLTVLFKRRLPGIWLVRTQSCLYRAKFVKELRGF